MTHFHNPSRSRRSNGNQPRRGEAVTKEEPKLKDAFQTSPGPATIFVPEFAIGSRVWVDDNCTVIDCEVYAIPSPNRYEVIDFQGFIHLTEPVENREPDGPVLRCVVSPKSKLSAGYDQSLSGGVKTKPRLNS